jgi:hypothetical protein
MQVAPKYDRSPLAAHRNGQNAASNASRHQVGAKSVSRERLSTAINQRIVMNAQEFPCARVGSVHRCSERLAPRASYCSCWPVRSSSSMPIAFGNHGPSRGGFGLTAVTCRSYPWAASAPRAPCRQLRLDRVLILLWLPESRCRAARHPCGDLRSRGETQLGEDAFDMAVGRAFGDD